jgi:phosphoglycolate phosphatase-like HAD superfamily hydrolase
MEKPIIYALDFDGVICDSAVETGITGWKAATHLWFNMQGDLPEQSLIDQFRLARPIIETGYEAILVMRLLFTGASIDSIRTGFDISKTRVQDQTGKSVEELKKLFGGVRDQWIRDNPKQWLEMNPLFPGVANKLQKLDQSIPWYIVTTKQERFVSQILTYNKVSITPENIFGLDRNLSKNEILISLIQQHQDQQIHFVEDRLPALAKVTACEPLKYLTLSFATWGYNTEKDKLDAKQPGIASINLDDFLSE